MPIGEIVTADELKRRYGSLQHLGPQPATTLKEPTPIGGVLSAADFKQQYGAAEEPPIEVGSTLSQEEFESRYGEQDQVGSPLRRGLGNMYSQLASGFYAADALWDDMLALGRKAPQYTSSEQIYDFLSKKAEQHYAAAKPPTGKYARAPESLGEWFDWGRVRQLIGEQGPTTAAILGAYLANPVVGAAMMFGVEAGGAYKTMEDWEKTSGESLPLPVKALVTVGVGSFNLALERTGMDKILAVTGGKGMTGKLFRGLIAALTEGGTEGLQRVTNLVAEAGYTGEKPENIAQQLMNETIGGTILGLTSSGVVGTGGTIGESPTGRPVRQAKSFEELNIPDTPTSHDAYRQGAMLPDEAVGPIKGEVERLQNEMVKMPREERLTKAAEYLGMQKRQQDLLEALSAKHLKHIEFDPDAGFVEHPFTDFNWDLYYEAVGLGSKKQAYAWAAKQVDGNEYIRYWEGRGPQPKRFRVDEGSLILGDIYGEVKETGPGIKAYHGTNETFKTFDPEAKSRGGIVFSVDPKVASTFGKRLIEARLNIKKMFDGRKTEHRNAFIEQYLKNRADKSVDTLNAMLARGSYVLMEDWLSIDIISKLGFDSSWQLEQDKDVYRVFDPTQVTSVREATSPAMFDAAEDVVPYKKPTSVKLIWQLLGTPEYQIWRTHKKNATRDSGKVIDGELLLNREVRKYDSWSKKITHRLGKGKQLTQEVTEVFYDSVSPRLTASERAVAKDRLTELYAEHPRLQGFVEGKDARGGIVKMFEWVKGRYKGSLRERLGIRLDPRDFAVVESLINTWDAQTPADRLDFDWKSESQRQIKERYDIEVEVRKRVNKKKGPGAWIKMSPEKQAAAVNQWVGSKAGQLGVKAKEYMDVDSWGIRDYVTHIENGSYRVVDEGGHTLALRRTTKEAKKAAYEIRQEWKDLGQEVRHLDVVASIANINPTKKWMDVLRGHKNLLDILPSYIYAMEKRIILDPIIDQYKQNVKNNPDEYTKDITDIIDAQIAAVRGANYSIGNRIADEIAQDFGWETGKYSRFVGKARKYTAWSKLGYRPAAAFVNMMGGYGNTWTFVGTQFFAKGWDAISSGVYKAPDGRVVNFKEKLAGLGEKGRFGIDFSVAESGQINVREPIYKPLGLFQLPEKPLRLHGFAANYIYQIEHLGKNDFEATEAALRNLKFQQFTYNISALPKILRSPTGKLVGQFKSYIVNQVQFLSSLRGKQLLRMIGVQLVMGGPRGAVYMMRSLPYLFAAGLLDDIEEKLVEGEGPISGFLSRGIAGVLGGDISAAAVMQFPHRPEDWAGPFVSEWMRFNKDVVFPMLHNVMFNKERPRKAYLKEDAVDWLTELSPLAFYWKDLVGMVIYEDYKTPSGIPPRIWIRDSAGKLAYQIGGVQDMLLLAAGVAPVEKSQYQVRKRIWRQDEKIWRENASKWYDRFTKKLMAGDPISKEMWQDGVLYGISPDGLYSAFQGRHLTPRVRELLKANTLRKAAALKHWPE